MLLVAVDVSKSELVCFDGRKQTCLSNTLDAIQRWLKQLPAGTAVALEPTNTFADLLAAEAFRAGHTVYMVQPTWVRAFRRSSGQRAKTDVVDARMIHEYVGASAQRLHPWRPLPSHLAELRSLVRQRQSVADDLARMRQTYKSLNMDPQLIEQVLCGLRKSKKHLDKAIAQTLKDIPQAKILMSMKGVGQLIAATLLVPLMHFGFKSHDSFVGFIGIDPVPNDSGIHQGRRSISKKGDPYLRRACFMAAMCASRYEP